MNKQFVEVCSTSKLIINDGCSVQFWKNENKSGRPTVFWWENYNDTINKQIVINLGNGEERVVHKSRIIYQEEIKHWEKFCSEFSLYNKNNYDYHFYINKKSGQKLIIG